MRYPIRGPSSPSYATCASASEKGLRGVLFFRRKTSNNASLGDVLNAGTTFALPTFLANASAPDDVWATTRAV
jgi:hypothetical protein